MARDKFKIWALGVAAGVCVFYLLTLRQGQTWMDDYAQYVMHAVNLAQGRPYADTGYIFNPLNQFIGPATYPPVFPLLLAPVCKLLGPDLQVMKALTCAAFGGFLYVMMLIFAEKFGARRALIAGAAIGLSPVFWSFKDYLYAEYPFLLFSFAALYVYGRARAAEAAGGRWLRAALAAGLLTYLAYGTRTLGALLPPVFLLADLAAGRKLSKTFFAAAAVAFCLGLAQNLTLHSDAVYADQTRAWFSQVSLWGALVNNFLNYTPRFALLFGGALGPGFGTALFAAAALLAAAGFGAAGKGGLSLYGVYVLVNLIFLMVCPASDGLRYAFQLAPFLLYYAFAGWDAVSARLGRAARLAGAALLLLTAVGYGAAYAKAQWTLNTGTAREETGQLFEFIRRAVPPSGAVIFRKPRTLALYTGRRSAMYHAAGDADLLAYFKQIGAGHLVTAPLFAEDRLVLIPFVERNPARFSQIYSNADFTVYRINP